MFVGSSGSNIHGFLRGVTYLMKIGMLVDMHPICKFRLGPMKDIGCCQLEGVSVWCAIAITLSSISHVAFNIVCFFK